MVEDYRIRFEIGRAVGTGRYVPARNQAGRKEVMEYRIIYVTNAGRFSPQEWHDRVMEAIEEDGETLLLEKIKDYCRRHCAWLRKESDIENHAASCLANRAYLYWKDFAEKEQGIFFVG